MLLVIGGTDNRYGSDKGTWHREEIVCHYQKGEIIVHVFLMNDKPHWGTWYLKCISTWSTNV